MLASLKISRSGEVNWKFYELTGERNGAYTHLKCLWNQAEVPIPEDYVVMVGDKQWQLLDTWSPYCCRLKGRRADENVLDMFFDAEVDMTFLDNWLESDVEKFTAQYKDVMTTELSEMPVELRPERLESVKAM